LQAPLHVHYGEDEGFYVLEGSVTIQVGDDTVELGPGQHAFGPRNIPHRFTVGPDGAHMIWVLTPGGFDDFVEEVSVPAEAPAVPPPSILPPEDAAEIVLRHGMELLEG
jgi:quercetin dioxygenase-like cupin family protein